MSVFSGKMGGKGIGRFIVGCLGLWIASVMTGCGAKEAVEDEAVAVKEEKEESVDDMIRKFFDDEELEYDLDCPTDSVTVYTLYYQDAVRMRVVVSMKSGCYLIEGGNSELIIPEGDVDVALEALNYNNIHSSISYGAMYEDRRVVFRLGRILEGGAFSREAFTDDYVMILKDAVEKIPAIYEIANHRFKPTKGGSK